MKQLQEYIQSKTARRILMGIGVLIVVLFVFEAGIWVGYRRGTFTCKLSDNYFRIFGEEQGEHMGLRGQILRGEMPGGHGATGKIVNVNLPMLVVADANRIEKSVHINEDTLIKRINETITASDLKTDDFIIVMGNPNDQGQIEARLIRVLPAPPGPPMVSTSTPTGAPETINTY